MNVEAAIRECLRQKHSKDLVVEECKDGPSAWGSHLRMDVWVMPRSWTKPACTAYEIKVSRSDFLKDDKWPGYLDLCNSFYFVCPTGLIQPEELPESAGLMWLSKTGTRLYTKRKAPLRDVTIPEDLWRYVLMCRASIGPERQDQSIREWWERWLEHKRIDREFGYRVSEAISSRVQEEVLNAQARGDRMEQAISEYEELRKVIVEVIGYEFDLDKPPRPWAFRHSLQDLQQIIPPKLRIEIRRLGERLSGVADDIDELEKKRGEES